MMKITIVTRLLYDNRWCWQLLHYDKCIDNCCVT